MASIPDRTLFLASDGAITTARLAASLRQLGLHEGDTVYVHSDLTHFGRVAPELLRERNTFFTAIEDVLLGVLGDTGTLLMPTHTIKSLASGRFSVTASPSETGALTEHFRLRPGVSRTAHPTHSAAVTGAKRHHFDQPPPDPFGVGSTFDQLTREGGKLLFLGADFHWCTFIHHIETIAGVRYRQRLPLAMTLEENGATQSLQAFRFVRPARYWPDFSRFRAMLVQRGILKEMRLGKAYLAVAECRPMLQAGLEALQGDPHLFLNVQPVMRQLLYDAKAWLRSALKGSGR